MSLGTAGGAIDYEGLGDADLAGLAAGRDASAVRLVTRRNNQRLFRAAWSILKDRAEAEDAVQDGYLKAFAAMAGFTGASSLSTWLTRIVINEARSRRRSARRRDRLSADPTVVNLDEYREKLMAGSNAPTPENALMRAQVARLLETALARVPEAFRAVFVLRDIEAMSTEEAAEALGIAPATVKTRLLRARRRLRRELDPDLRRALSQTMVFAGADCEAMTARVLAAWAGDF